MKNFKDDDECETEVYSILGFKYDVKPTSFEVGGIWLIVIFTFPIWVWFYILFRLIEEFGKTMNGVKVKKIIKSKAQQHSEYY